jgi:anaerobic magnesium-protoporphyrin IX monomethyl ester cyclase
MEKGIRVQQIAEARARLKASGIKACFFIQFGYPGEVLEDILATVQMVRDTLPDDIGVSVSYPLPGTRFYDMVKEQLGAKTNWSDSDDLAMMFQGTYQSPFYRKLHRVLHDDLALFQRLHTTVGPLDATTLAALDSQEAAWLELYALEGQYRNSTPVLIARTSDARLAPDLSKAWNA